MDIKKGRLYLNKINRLFPGIEEEGGQVSQIEKDLMLNYVRNFYDALLGETAVPVVSSQPVAAPKPKATPKVEVPPVIQPEPKPTPKVEVKVTPPIVPVTPVKEVPVVQPPVVKSPVVEQKPTATSKPEPKIIIHTPKLTPEEVAPPVQPTMPKPKPPIHQQIPIEIEPPVVASAPTSEPKAVDFDEYDILFEAEKITDLSSRLSQSKISNLRAAMGINERFLIQNELFGGNNDSFNEAIDKLNGFSNFLEAKAHIIKELAPQNDWLNDKRLKRAKSFIGKVNRRYK